VGKEGGGRRDLKKNIIPLIWGWFTKKYVSVLRGI
jgi:hypothetical protein